MYLLKSESQVASGEKATAVLLVSVCSFVSSRKREEKSSSIFTKLLCVDTISAGGALCVQCKNAAAVPGVNNFNLF